MTRDWLKSKLICAWLFIDFPRIRSTLSALDIAFLMFILDFWQDVFAGGISLFDSEWFNQFNQSGSPACPCISVAFAQITNSCAQGSFHYTVRSLEDHWWSHGAKGACFADSAKMATCRSRSRTWSRTLCATASCCICPSQYCRISCYAFQIWWSYGAMVYHPKTWYSTQSTQIRCNLSIHLAAMCWFALCLCEACVWGQHLFAIHGMNAFTHRFTWLLHGKVLTFWLQDTPVISSPAIINQNGPRIKPVKLWKPGWPSCATPWT